MVSWNWCFRPRKMNHMITRVKKIYGKWILSTQPPNRPKTQLSYNTKDAANTHQDSATWTKQSWKRCFAWWAIEPNTFLTCWGTSSCNLNCWLHLSSWPTFGFSAFMKQSLPAIYHSNQNSPLQLSNPKKNPHSFSRTFFSCSNIHSPRTSQNPWSFPPSP